MQRAEPHEPRSSTLADAPSRAAVRGCAENQGVQPAEPREFAPLVLGPLSIWPPVVLAPMAGVTSYPFRSLCREFGAGLYVSEMITARGYLNGNRMSVLLASSREGEKPRSVHTRIRMSRLNDSSRSYTPNEI